MKKVLLILMILLSTLLFSACIVDPPINNDYSEGKLFYDGLGKVYEDGKIFFINEKGKKAFSESFDDAYNFYKGSAIVYKEDNCYMIDMNGKKISDDYRDLYLYKEYDVIVYYKRTDTNRYYGILDLKGNKITKVDYDDLEIYDRDFVSVEKDGLFGVIDIKGNIVIDLKYESRIYDYKFNMAKIHIDNKIIVIDKEENVLLEHNCSEKYEQLEIISEDMYFARRLLGLDPIRNFKKEQLFLDSYQYKFSTDEGTIVMYDHNISDYPYMLYNNKAEKITEDCYSNIEEKDGYLLCEKDGLYYVYNLKGEKLIETGYEYISLSDSYIICEDLHKDDPEDPGYLTLKIDYYKTDGELIYSFDTNNSRKSARFIYDEVLNEYYLVSQSYSSQLGDYAKELFKIENGEIKKLNVEVTYFIVNGCFLYQEVNYSNPYDSIFTIKDINGNVLKEDIKGRVYTLTKDGYLLFEGEETTIIDCNWKKIYEK